MDQRSVRFFYDYVDPLSYVMSEILPPVLASAGTRLSWIPLEVNPPPHALLDPRDPGMAERMETAQAIVRQRCIPLRPPTMVPWSRKAHELALHARRRGCFSQVHGALFRSYFVEGTDIGRIDVLVEIGVAGGLDPTATKAVLDVDRFTERLRHLRSGAEALGVSTVPTLLLGDRRLEGLQSPESVLARVERATGEMNH